MIFRCPHCGTKSPVRTSQYMSPTVTWLYVQCRNIECGHTWRVDAEASVTISPSAIPNPTVNMAISQHANRNLMVFQLDTAIVGEHKPHGPQQLGLQLDNHDGDRAPVDALLAMNRP